MSKAILVAQFLRARAWWRLDSAGANPLPTVPKQAQSPDTLSRNPA